jgi:hypothetical protein
MSHGFKPKRETKRKHRPTYRPKIQWELFGIENPKPPTELSMETIRSTVSSLAGMRLAREPIGKLSTGGKKKASSKSSLPKSS